MNERVVPLIHRFIEPLKRFLRGPYALLAAVGLALVIGGLALHEHDARLRRSIELRQSKTETVARVKELEEQAAAAVRVANQRNALVIRELEAGRQKLATEGERLRQRLAALEREGRARVERVATLPSNELAQRVAARLGTGAGEARDSGLATRDSGLGTRGSGLGILNSGNTGGPLPVADSSSLKPGSTKENPSTQPPAPSPEATAAEPTMTLDTAALRQVETAFVRLESCREQSAAKDEQVANCREQLAASAAVAARMDDSLRELNQAIRLKDEILERREALHHAELKAARGSRLSRMRKALTYVAAGVVIGVAAR